MKRCLVTGGAGFIGSHIVDALVKRKMRVVVLDNFSTGSMLNLEAVRSKIKIVRGDIRNLRVVKNATKDVDYVFHLAANRAVLRSVDNPLETNENNVTGTLNVLVAARDYGVKRVVYTSSSSVYGDNKKFPLNEAFKPMPESPYAAQKLMGEYYAKLFYCLYGLETVSLRYFNVFGPRQNPESKYSAVIPIFIDCVLKNKSPEIHWDGKQSRDFSYVDNVVEGNLKSMTASSKVAGEVFNIACHDEYSVLDIFNEIKFLLKKPHMRAKFTPKRKGDVRRTYADIQKAKRLLNFKVKTRFKPGMRKTVAWFLSTRGLK
ncbi:MAG: LPS biosynthesis protein WbpP [Candidatus Omnitrophica bacterium CG11_big_fil_rev_8_21_14_0_20_45_26]|uniref:LPS biosynthesis protein WbpP n=1 Tax=Candidatus Abzuiibacterium crystallinum TaxID=1974748 RepID=A0A2H0LLS2_9BACT|nr:MAG: LPS biosynthesis protein WbpP [Candidatus Omnitrophica bacterium CG11_big_fil_rev_8_21_14_0_20_45_26]PIW63245.1 MAG: LPS biosynthesis protein WbpP [Candidatus Omnitrophica bacterium CG12_big_fil_rev_8_21_14_0_65_45_16]